MTTAAVTATKNQIEQWQETLVSSGSIVSRAEAANLLADAQVSYDKDWIITVYDRMWNPVGELGDDLMELSGTDPRNNMPSAQMKIKGNSPLTKEFMACETTMVGVTVETGGLRFPFYVKKFEMEFSEAEWTGNVELYGIWDILNHLVIWPNFLLPIQAQIPSHAVFFWGLCTVIESMICECALRIQAGLWEFVNNALSLNPDIRAWFGTLLQSNGNIFQMLKTPIYVVRTNPFTDTSPLYVRTVRMETCGEVIIDATKSHGVDVRVDLWLPGDEQPDFWTRNFPFLALTQPTYVVTVKDRSRITGPTGTIIDSVLRNVVDLTGIFLSDIIPVIEQVPGREGVYIAPIIGVDYTPPWTVLIAPDTGKKGSVLSCTISHHTPDAWQHIIGGRSPKWLNDLMNATFAWIIDSISILIGVTGIPSNLLDGFLNNSFLAFQLIQHYGRRNEVGPYHPGIEKFHATASAPYNIETLFAFINALWDSRGWVSAIVMFRNDEVYKLGKDFCRGALMSLVYYGRTRLYTDYIENVMFRLSPTERDLLVQIGDGRAEESPLAKHQRFITSTMEALNVLTLAPQS